ncbi:MAG TPA: hypothetical protein DCX53_07625, partial [Anaerolineae bacterium]|nr:hypothetical protein [Anaerolineae bacterium]
MKKLRSAQILIYIYCTLLIVSALFVLGWMLFSPSEPGNAILFGLSLPRLVFVLGLLIAIMILGIVIMKAGRDQIWAEKFLERWFGEGRYSKILSWLAGISFGLGWIALFLPIDRVGPFVNYWMRIRPAMVFILLAGIITLIMFIVRRGTFSFSELKKSKTLKLSIILFVFSLPIFGWMLYSRFGISMPEDFWYNAGVPVLVSQLIGAIFGGVVFLHIQQNRKFKRFDLVVFVLIFAATALLWAHEPLQKGFSFVGPYLPNDVYYPLFDAGVFDSASQFPLIGQNIFIFNGNFFERPLYLSFLVYLHSLFGQDYETLMAAQAGVFAIFPPLIYLIGRSLNMRVVGFTAALVAMLRGINSIAASNMMDLANPKMMLTDFPAAIGVALIILLTCEWLKSTETKPQYALGLGGVLGFALMLRTNALILMALIPLFALVKFAPKWKDWLAHCVLIVIGVLAITLPWELRNHSLGGQMYSGIIFKFQGVIDQRYSPPEPAGLAPHMDNKLFTLESTKVVSTFLQDDYLAQDSFPCNSIFCFVPNHFLHNIFTSI